MQIITQRGWLSRTIKALDKEELTIGFTGGSITDARPEWNWPEPVIAWFLETFPRVRIRIENAAIGATGSDLAVFRAQESLIEKGCDLVFIEYAVNDLEQPTWRRMRTREGLVRKLLKDGGCDLIFTYTFSQPMYADMTQDRVPDSIKEFEQIASHYKIGSVWMGLHALQEVMNGRMRWEEWLPDGLHPQSRGSLSYAQSVITYLEKELLETSGRESTHSSSLLPEALDADNWEKAHTLSLSQVELEGPWVIRNWPKLAYIDHVISCSAVGAKLAFYFEGRGLILGFDFGRSSAEFKYRLDGGEWKTSRRDRPDWCPPDGWYRLFPVAEDLPVGKHTFELEVIHGNPDPASVLSAQYTGTNCRLALIGILP
jgi:lysophospholipase L1-like esterase